ncbi:arylacetamide deacetylase-like 4 [Hemicordylus capensis]|uniref:arylacetamide deacetylase-like 4 n=1 Tax=Hemicordylus capensis TaxID=884348 RepID=UPI0023028E87|nr:arylacetamide deacetylase-like 4 [Hemicordylus capensis]
MFHLAIIWAFRLGKLFEKMGICSQIHFIRFLMNIPQPGKDPKLLIKDAKFEHLPVRIYHPKGPYTGLRRGLLYIHGGCGMFGCNRTYERMCRYLARESDSVVVYIEYRLGPEYQHPIQLTDCLTATKYFMKNAKDYGVDPNRIILAGESCGGSICAAISRELVKRDYPLKLRAQVLLYPLLQIVNVILPSYQQNRFGPGLTSKRGLKLGFQYLNEEVVDVDELLKNAHVPEDMREKYNKWIGADCIPEEFKARGYEPLAPAPFRKELFKKARLDDETLLSPILDEDAIIQQLPETYILTCEYDILRDDGLLYKKRLEDNDVPVTWHHLKDGFHGLITFINAWPFEFSSTKAAFEGILSFIKRL